MHLLALVGLPGSGKSTVGRQLARALSTGFVDSDKVIEEQIGCSIREFFEREGEDAFREVEAATIDRLTQSFQGVLATGGGSVVRAENRAALRQRCQVVYLRSTPEELIRRLRHDGNRPLLHVGDPMLRLRELLSLRDPLYRETAHFVVQTGRPSVTRLVNLVIEQLDAAGIVLDPTDLAVPPPTRLIPND